MYKNILEEIVPLRRSLLGSENDKALEIIESNFPLKIHSFKSGEKVLDWTVPQEWKLKRATLVNDSGDHLCDTDRSILEVVNYSIPHTGVYSYEEIRGHLHTSSNLTEAIPYRTSYYNKNWGFCLSEEKYEKLDKQSNYRVDIDSTFVDSVLNIGELRIPGRSSEEVILTSYLCHPEQAHDGLSGVICLLNLYNKLKDRDNLYTYRFFFLPETIGPICLLARNIIDPSNVFYGMVCTCVGFGDSLTYKETFIGNHPIDNLVRSKNKTSNQKFIPQGSDERQFSSPKMRIPVSSIMTSPHSEFPEYHTSHDNLDLVEEACIDQVSSFYYDIIIELDKRKCYTITHDGGEPFMANKNIYRKTGGPSNTFWDTVRNWVIFLSDGRHSILDMSIKAGIDVKEIKNCVKILEDKNIIKVVSGVRWSNSS